MRKTLAVTTLVFAVVLGLFVHSRAGANTSEGCRYTNPTGFALDSSTNYASNQTTTSPQLVECTGACAGNQTRRCVAYVTGCGTANGWISCEPQVGSMDCPSASDCYAQSKSKSASLAVTSSPVQ